MIKNIFLPESIGNFYLFSSHVVGIEINKTHINACLTKKSGNTALIQKFIDEPIEQGSSSSYTERTAQALKQTITQLGSYDRLISILPSSVVFFKELQLPFIDREKISLVIGFEIEPLLPFPVSQAVIDFIITKQTAEQTTILVAAVQKKYVQEHIELFKAAQVPAPDAIVVDFLVLYDLYRQNSFYRSLSANALMTDFGVTMLRMGYIESGQLKQIRTISGGTSAIAKAVSEQMHITPAQAMEQLLRFGTTSHEKPDYERVATESLVSLCKAIQLTSMAFASADKQLTDDSVILLVGPGARIPGIDTLISTQINRRCLLVDSTKLLEGAGLTVSKDVNMPPAALISAGATNLSVLTNNFNVSLAQEEQADTLSFLVQALTSSVLLALCIIALGGHLFMQVRKLRKEIRASSAQAIETLREKFPEIDEDEIDLDEAINTAQSTVETREKTWYKFSKEQRLSPLKYLLELTSTVDKNKLNLDLEQLTILDTIMTLKGKVKDTDALKALEREIKQKFEELPPYPQDAEFQMRVRLKPGQTRKK